MTTRENVILRVRYIHCVAAAGAIHYGMPCTTSDLTGTLVEGSYWFGDGSGGNCWIAWDESGVIAAEGGVEQRLSEFRLAPCDGRIFGRNHESLSNLVNTLNMMIGRSSGREQAARWIVGDTEGGSAGFRQERLLETFFVEDPYDPDASSESCGIRLEQKYELDRDQFSLVAGLARASLLAPVTLSPADVDTLLLERCIALQNRAAAQDVRLAAEMFLSAGIRWEGVLTDPQEAERIAERLSSTRVW